MQRFSRMGTAGQRAWSRTLVAVAVMCLIWMSACGIEDESQFATILDEGNVNLDCANAARHPYPQLFGDYQLRPKGEGNVTYYGSSLTSYANSPELVWVVEVGSGPLTLYVEHEKDDDLDLFLLRTCSASDVLAVSQRREGYQEQIHYAANVGGRYYVVVDGAEGKFHGAGASLQVAVLPTVRVTVLDAQGLPRNGVEVACYDAQWDYCCSLITDGSGSVVWNRLISGTTYHFIAYGPTSCGEGGFHEQWGNAEYVTVPNDGELRVNMQRYYPYVERVEMLNTSLLPNTQFELGDTVVIRTQVVNHSDTNREVFVVCYVDNDCQVPWNFVSRCSSTVLSSARGTFDFKYPTAIVGTFFVRPCSTVSSIADSRGLTDSWGCSSQLTFEVSPPRG